MTNDEWRAALNRVVRGEPSGLPKADPIRLEVGADVDVTIDKLFGPLAMDKIRVSIDFEAAAWVVEVQRFESEDDLVGVWVEAARIRGQ